MSMNLEMSHMDPFARLRAQTQGSSQFAYPVASGANHMASSIHTNGPMAKTLASDPFVKHESSAAVSKTQSTTTFLKNFVWRPALDEVEASNTTEAALLALIDDTLCISSVANIARLLDLLTSATTEPERALVLVILRGTATSSNAKLAKTCIAAYEKRGGLKIAKRWLEDAVEWNHTDLLVLLLEVLKTLPLQLTSITEARINEPIVNLRKSAREEKVKRTAQELLKYWRNKFTEKAKAHAPPPASTSAAQSEAPAKIAAASAATTSSTSTSSSTASDKVAPASAATASTPVAAKSSTDGPSPTKLKPLKKRTIKRLERLPYGGGTSVSKSSSSDLIGNLMQRKSAKDAAAAAKPKNDSLMQKLSAKELASNNNSKSSSSSSSSSESATASKSSSPPPPAVAEAKDEVFTMALPTIQSFNAAVSSSSSSGSSKKIRWADEEGKELVKVKFIESWRDLILYDPSQNEESFRDAKLREHANERNAMKGHKGAEHAPIVVAHEWTAPALMKLPEALEKRRHAVSTDEVAIQSARTRREMEYLVLDGEIPPSSPKEWERSGNDLQRGPPIAIPLSDVGAPAEAVLGPVAPTAFSNEPPQSFYEAESDEDRALREALGPLQKSTIALLLENEDILPQVYDEAQRNGNRIPDGRVVEILEQRRHQQQQQRYGHGATNSGSAYNNSNSGYGGHGSGSMYPPTQQPPFSDYNNSNSRQPLHGGAPGPHAFHQQQPPLLGHMGPGKRKAPGAGGILSDGPPPKRMMKRGPGSLPCIYFPMPAGCKHGNACLYIHDYNALPPAAAASGGGNSEYNNYHGAGRFGHGQYASSGMRGGGGNGMRHMHSGR